MSTCFLGLSSLYLSLSQIMEWISAILDSHFGALVLFSATHRIVLKSLRAIQGAVQKELHDCSLIEDLRNHVMLLQNCKQQRNGQIVDYSVEVLCV